MACVKRTLAGRQSSVVINMADRAPREQAGEKRLRLLSGDSRQASYDPRSYKRT